MRFQGISSGVQGVLKEVGPRATNVVGGRFETRPWRTVGRAIPRRDARPQSPPPFRPAVQPYIARQAGQQDEPAWPSFLASRS